MLQALTTPLFPMNRQSLAKEIVRREGGEDEAVIRESGQRRAIQEFQEPENGDVGDDERRHKADGQDAEIRKGEIAPRFQ